MEDYIKSQYFGKSPLLLSALNDKLDRRDVALLEIALQLGTEFLGAEVVDVERFVLDAQDAHLLALHREVNHFWVSCRS